MRNAVDRALPIVNVLFRVVRAIIFSEPDIDRQLHRQHEYTSTLKKRRCNGRISVYGHRTVAANVIIPRLERQAAEAQLARLTAFRC